MRQPLAGSSSINNCSFGIPESPSMGSQNPLTQNQCQAFSLLARPRMRGSMRQPLAGNSSINNCSCGIPESPSMGSQNPLTQNQSQAPLSTFP